MRGMPYLGERMCACGCERTFRVYAPNAKYAPACRPAQGEPLRRDLCPCGCGERPCMAVGARFYCATTAALLRGTP